jgi:hypothetical protein
MNCYQCVAFFLKSVFQKECFTPLEIMLEGLISWFLNNQLGKYLENVDTDQLSFSILQVPVTLQHAQRG